MLKIPSYISRNRNGTYYFRLVIPIELRDYFPYKREFNRSLRTDSKKIAIKRARRFMTKIDEAFAFLEAKKRGSGSSQSWTQIKNIELKDWTKIEEITVDHGSPEQEAQAIAKIINSTTSNVQALPEIKLSKVINDFCDENASLGNWQKKTEDENRSIFTLFLTLVGDSSFSSLHFEQLTDYKKKIIKLPPNMNKSKEYRDKSIEEILQMVDVKPMAKNTLNKHFNRISGLFDCDVSTLFQTTI